MAVPIVGTGLLRVGQIALGALGLDRVVTRWFRRSGATDERGWTAAVGGSAVVGLAAGAAAVWYLTRRRRW